MDPDLGLPWGRRTLVMGVLNATPDSFSGDGLFGQPDWVDEAVRRAVTMVAAGADLLDIGGESTRPGAAPVSLEEELRRVLPVVAAVHRAVAVPLSIDTRKGAVAAAALAAGAVLVNDVSGGADPALLRVVAAEGVPLILMHSRRGRRYDDVVDETRHGLAAAMDRALAAGCQREQLVLDPGYGFGGPPAEQFHLLRRLPELRALGRPLCVGTSRKRSLSRLLGSEDPVALVHATSATVALAIAGGADLVRVHDVGALVPVVRVSDAIVRGIDTGLQPDSAGRRRDGDGVSGLGE